MILLLGDIHGNTVRLHYAIKKATEAEAAAIIQVGDFGLFKGKRNESNFYDVCKESEVPIYFIDGNHDDCTHWVQYDKVTRIFHDANLFYIPRGTVMEIDGRTIAFMGGAASIDKQIRIQEGMHWDKCENISPQEVLRMFNNIKGKNIDFLITHDTPISVTKTHFDDNEKLWFGVPKDWHDHNMDIIQIIWEALGKPKLYCGHMHRSVIGPNYRILNIDELLDI